MTLTESDLAEAIRAYTEHDRVPPELHARLLAALPRARRRRMVVRSATGAALAVVAAVGGSQVVTATRRTTVTATASIVPSPPPLPAGVPAPLPPPAGETGDGLTAAQRAAFLGVARRAAVALVGSTKGSPVRLDTTLVTPALAGALAGSPPSAQAALAYGLIAGGVDPGSVAHPDGDYDTTVTPTVLGHATTGGTSSALVDVTLTSYSTDGTAGNELEMVVVDTPAGPRVTSLASVATASTSLVAPVGSATTANGAQLVAVARAVAARYAAQDPSTAGSPSLGDPVVVLSGAAGAVVDVPGVPDASGDQKSAGVLRVTFGRAGVLSVAPLGY